jgi:hypothetical protein
MPDKKIPTVEHDKSQYHNYWKKAREFRHAMQQSMGADNWGGVPNLVES